MSGEFVCKHCDAHEEASFTAAKASAHMCSAKAAAIAAEEAAGGIHNPGFDWRPKVDVMENAWPTTPDRSDAEP